MRIKYQPKKETPFWALTRTVDVLWTEILNHLQKDWSKLFQNNGVVCEADVIGEDLQRRVTLQGHRVTETGRIEFSIYLRMREVEDYADQFVVVGGNRVEIVDMGDEETRQQILSSLGAGEMLPVS